jgi:hypothetical protein
MLNNLILFIVLSLCIVFAPQFAQAAKADRVAVEATVRKELTKDLAAPWNPAETLVGRVGLDGRPVKDFPGEIVEVWANLEWCAV